MKIVSVPLPGRSYPVLIGEQLLSLSGKLLRDFDLGRDAVIVTNALIARLHGGRLRQSLVKAGFSVKFLMVPDGEQSKSSLWATRLTEQIARYDLRRKIFVIAFGGGVIGDLAGFVAAIYKRGVPYVQIPTTLLAQVDSAIGGKVAIDLSVGKNLVGAFYQPRLVISDVSVLNTLSDRQVRNGLAEVVKYGVIQDAKLFRFLEQKASLLLKKDTASLAHVVEASSRIKASVVGRDEKEIKGLRRILNFGHTAGHAIETAGGYQMYHHGEAIALGMRVAAILSQRLNNFPSADSQRLNQLLSDIQLPARIEKLPLARIFSAMGRDKKFSGTTNRFILARCLGRVDTVENVPLAMVKEAILSLML